MIVNLKHKRNNESENKIESCD